VYTKADDCAIIFLVMYQNEDKIERDEVETQDRIIKENRFDHIPNLVWMLFRTSMNSNQLNVLLTACVFYLGLFLFLRLISSVSGSSQLYLQKGSC
jgi:hypothetical protein